jgi:hypothetical protein
MRQLRPLILAACALAVAACSGDWRMTAEPVQAVSDRAARASMISRLAGLRVAFGHQSVGFDLLNGIKDLAAAEPAANALRIVESTAPADLAMAGIAHFRIGRNGDPRSKLADWTRTVRAGLAAQADVALFKLCYDDIAAQSDVDALFDAYRATVDALERDYPEVAFLHVTVPLTTLQRGPKALVKRVLGRPVAGERENMNRERFNERIRSTYRREALFDLAAIEATAPDGRMTSFPFAGGTVRSLVPDYTDDGAHLNERGRQFVANQLIAVITAAVDRSRVAARDVDRVRVKVS